MGPMRDKPSIAELGRKLTASRRDRYTLIMFHTDFKPRFSGLASTGWLLMAALFMVIGGCAGPSTGDRLDIQGSQYPEAFKAAQEAARSVGMPPLVSDPVGGIIEGRPRIAGSIIEPWRLDNADFDQVVENTINKQRRRVRFEFLPIDFRPAEPTGEGRLQGPVVPGSTIDLQRSINLVNYQNDIEVRVWVYMERQFIPYLQRSTWSRVGNDFATNPLDTEPRLDGTTRSSGLWTPVGRDEAMERTLLSRVRKSLMDAAKD